MVLPKEQTQQLSGTQELQNVSIMPLTNKKTIAAQYNVCVKTLGRWLKDANITIPRGLIRPCEQALIHQIINEQRRMSPNVSKDPQKNEY
jgi:abortive infection bacteriophage resistance protein